MSIIRGEEVEFLSHGVTMGPEMIDPWERHKVMCVKCESPKFPSAFTPSQLKLTHPQCRECRAVTEKKRRVGGAKCDMPMGTFQAWNKEKPSIHTVAMVQEGCARCLSALDRTGGVLCAACRDSVTEYKLNIYLKRKALGMCADCGKEKDGQGVRCEACRVKFNARKRESYAKARRG